MLSACRMIGKRLVWGLYSCCAADASHQSGKGQAGRKCCGEKKVKFFNTNKSVKKQMGDS